MKIGFRAQITSTQNRILGALDTLRKSAGVEQATIETSLADISTMLLTIQAGVGDIHIQHRILRQLVFEDMDYRAKQIPKDAPDTYNWTVEDGPFNERDKRARAWQLFLEWLRVGDKILHVSGNPGSGKSTLMKFLSQHERTKEELQVWAAPNRLVFCVFYFWNPGCRLQRTLAGLYRSLLFQALSQCPELAAEVFPVQYRRMKASVGDTMVEKIQHFDEDRIEEGFKLLLDRASTGGYRLCFFIDGLDECEGNRLQHEDLAKMLQNWINSGTLKICVSSRPYSEFIRPLDHPGNRLIQLHELNGSDISAYCLDRLANDIDGRKRGNLCRQLVPIVVEQAQGVFLWVHLVIDLLLVGFRQDDSDSVLEAQLRALPPDLDMLYTKLREPIEADRVQRARSNRMLLLAARNPCLQDLTAMAFSWLEGQQRDQAGLLSPDFPSASDLKPYSEDEIASRLEHVTKQIDGLARGFLEIRGRTAYEVQLNPPGQTRSFFDSMVRFCHRTARDYLIHSADRRCALLESFPNFEVSQVYAKIRIAENICGWHSRFPPGHDVFVNFDRPFRRNIDPDLIAKFEVPLRESLTPTTLHTFCDEKAQFWDPPPSGASFLAYAAYCGLDRFVLREVARDVIETDRAAVSGSVLVAAVKKLHFELASKLLTMGRGMNELCVVSDGDGDMQRLVPACIVAIAGVLTELIEFRIRRLSKTRDWLAMARDLLKFSLALNFSAWAIVHVMYLSRKGSDCKWITEVQFRIAVADAVELFENLGNGSKDCNTESLRSLDIVTFQETKSDRAGRVEDQGPVVMRWLKAWLGPPCTGNGHEKTSSVMRTLRLEKMEWSSNTQELVELRGSTRLY